MSTKTYTKLVDVAGSPSRESTRDGWGRLFDELKDKDGLISDAALARSLGVTPSYLSAVRRLKKGVSIELGETIYKRLGRDLSVGNLQMFVPVRVRTRSSIKTFQAMNASFRIAVLERAGGKCELCRRPAPFLLPDGTPYLEVHHVVPSTSGGEDSTSNLVALCPNCHKKMHFSPTDSDTKKLFTRATPKKA